jgi:Uma2 family endonuclease
MTTAAVDVRPWTREEYERLVQQGFFRPEERLELVDGVVFEMTPQTSRHASAVRLTQIALQALYPRGFDIRTQMPLALGTGSEPEPDLAIVPGDPRDYIASHPTTAVLVVEVADTSLLHDRKRKAMLYARSGIPEYWLLNLVDWCLEVFLEPQESGYRSRLVLKEGDSVAPLTRPRDSIPVSSLLPRS